MQYIKFFFVIILTFNNIAYADIRGEFAKRSAPMPPSPAAVVQYLVDDEGNARAQAQRECFVGKIISVNLASLEAVSTYTDAINRALRNSKMEGYSYKDFLVNSVPALLNTYYDTSRIQIDASATSVPFLDVPRGAGVTTCSDVMANDLNACALLSSCGSIYNGVRIGGCLASGATSTIPTNTINVQMVIEILTLNVPKTNNYFVNPAYSGSPYALIANPTAPNGNIIGCPDPNPTIQNACQDGQQVGAYPFYQLDPASPGPAVANLVPFQNTTYVLAFRINQCPKG